MPVKIRVVQCAGPAGRPCNRDGSPLLPSMRNAPHSCPFVRAWFLVRISILLFLASTPRLAHCESASRHILMVSLSLRGHIVPLTRLATELSERGHRVSFAVSEEGRDYVNKTGAKFLSLGRLPITKTELRDKLRQISHDSSFFRGMLTLLNDVYAPHSSPIFKALSVYVKKDPPDLMVIDIGALGGLDVAQTFNIPYVINNPSLVFRMDNTPHYLPAWGSGFSRHMTLWERCLSVLYPRLLAVSLTPTFMELNKLRYQRSLPLYRSHQEIFENAIVMVNTAFGFEHPLPLSPLVKLTGPLLPKPDPDDPEGQPVLLPQIQTWLDKGSKPVVLVLFGSGSMSHLEAWQVKQIAQGLSDSRFRVLWALRPDGDKNNPAMKDLPPSVFKIKNNFAQLPVIAHPAVRVVMCPCGMGTAQEALYYGKTLLCVPMLGDQIDVAARVVDAGAGLIIDKGQLDVADISRDVVALYKNATFRQAAKRIGKMLRAAGGTPLAADIVESAISPGIEHLISPHSQLPWHQAQNVDVLAILVAVLCLLVLLLRSCWVVALCLRVRLWRLFKSYCPQRVQLLVAALLALSVPLPASVRLASVRWAPRTMFLRARARILPLCSPRGLCRCLWRVGIRLVLRLAGLCSWRRKTAPASDLLPDPASSGIGSASHLPASAGFSLAASNHVDHSLSNGSGPLVGAGSDSGDDADGAHGSANHNNSVGPVVTGRLKHRKMANGSAVAHSHSRPQSSPRGSGSGQEGAGLGLDTHDSPSHASEDSPTAARPQDRARLSNHQPSSSGAQQPSAGNAEPPTGAPKPPNGVSPS